MEQSVKREGENLEEIERQFKEDINTSNKACVWGIQKYFDPKQCYKYFVKNFGDHSNLSHICKFKNKPFFVLKFEEAINIEDFNTKNAKNKRVKIKALQQNMLINQQDFMTVELCTRPAEKRDVKATEEEILKVKSTNISDIVQPLHSLPYEQQIQHKVKDINRVVENYNRAFYNDNEVKRLLKEQIELKQLKMDQFIQCKEKREGYRSKSQFTVGLTDKDEPVIGFNKGSYHNQTIMVQTCKNVKIISKNTKLIVAVLESFLKSTKSECLLPFDRIGHVGFWRYVIIRESDRTNQSMLMIVCKTQGFEEEVLKDIKEKLVQCLKKSIIGLTSLCFLSYNGEADSVPTEKPELLYGKPFYQEKIFDHIFQVSPSAFLQIHIDMCEVLYSQIIKAVSDCDVVLDLGCGIGTIGITIQNKLPNIKVIGVEICEEAVEDARKNSQKYEVHLGRAEDLIKSVCDQYRGNRIIAILDPPRAGFNKEVILALRRCRGLDNIIYVACNAGAIQDNLLQLTLPVTERRRAPEFKITSMKGFDLFPLTAHYEVLYTMKRVE